MNNKNVIIKDDDKKKVIKNEEEDSIQALQVFEDRILSGIESYGLPVENVLVSVDERATVFNNVGPVLNKISVDKKIDSIYFSKFLAATAVGLFDAALNYLWDETISEIRKRVIQYDVQYFYDNAIKNEEKRKKFKKAEDMTGLDDSELIQGARNIGLISELGYKHLDYIRFMRNWASAAHPNQNQLTGLNLIAWMEICIKEVISLPLSDTVIEIQRLLVNIKSNELTEEDSKKIIPFFVDLSQQQVNHLALGFLGIYTDHDTSSLTHQNIQYLIPSLWGRVDEETRDSIGIKYGKLIANGDQEGAKQVRNILDLVVGLSYIPEGIKTAEIENTIQNLLDIHHAMNNFYNEPIFAKQLYNIIGNGGEIPDQIKKKVVGGIVKVFLTNGNGIARSAEKYYINLIKQFNQKEALLAIISFTDERIASSLQFDLCEKKYKELLKLTKGKFTSPAIIELFDEIENFSGRLDLIAHDKKIKQKIENIKIILKS